MKTYGSFAEVYSSFVEVYGSFAVTNESWLTGRSSNRKGGRQNAIYQAQNCRGHGGGGGRGSWRRLGWAFSREGMYMYLCAYITYASRIYTKMGAVVRDVEFAEFFRGKVCFCVCVCARVCVVVFLL